MKKIFVIAFTVAGSFTAFGQNNAQEASEMTNKLVTDLSLTAEQAQKVADIYNGIGAKNEAVLTDPNATEQFKKDAVAGNTQAGKDLVLSVLTEEQKAKWNEIQAKQTSRKANVELKKVPVKQAKPAPAPAKQ
jgi:hypothetical protein